PDPGTNGGVTVVTSYPASLALPASDGFVAIARGETIIDRVEYGPGWPVPTGRSLSLDPPQFPGISDLNDDPFNWCATDGPNGVAPPPIPPNPPCHIMEPIPWDPSLDIENDPAAVQVNPASGGATVNLPFPFVHFGRTYPGPVSFLRMGVVSPSQVGQV